MKPFLVLGHRGSPRRFRENTIASLAAALEEGADGFETDLRRLADGARVLFHDERVARAEVETLTADQVRAQWGEIASVAEALQQFAHRRGAEGDARIFLDLEIKRAGWEDELLGLLEPYDGFVVSSFEREVIENLRRRALWFDLGLITREREVACSDVPVELGVEYFFPRFDVVDESVVARCHDAGARVIPWSPDRTREWNRLFDIGCDGMITDYPREAVKWRKGRD